MSRIVGATQSHLDLLAVFSEWESLSVTEQIKYIKELMPVISDLFTKNFFSPISFAFEIRDKIIFRSNHHVVKTFLYMILSLGEEKRGYFFTGYNLDRIEALYSTKDPIIRVLVMRLFYNSQSKFPSKFPEYLQYLKRVEEPTYDDLLAFSLYFEFSTFEYDHQVCWEDMDHLKSAIICLLENKERWSNYDAHNIILNIFSAFMSSVSRAENLKNNRNSQLVQFNERLCEILSLNGLQYYFERMIDIVPAYIFDFLSTADFFHIYKRKLMFKHILRRRADVDHVSLRNVVYLNAVKNNDVGLYGHFRFDVFSEKDYLKIKGLSHNQLKKMLRHTHYEMPCVNYFLIKDLLQSEEEKPCFNNHYFYAPLLKGKKPTAIYQEIISIALYRVCVAIKPWPWLKFSEPKEQADRGKLIEIAKKISFLEESIGFDKLLGGWERECPWTTFISVWGNWNRLEKSTPDALISIESLLPIDEYNIFPYEPYEKGDVNFDKTVDGNRVFRRSVISNLRLLQNNAEVTKNEILKELRRKNSLIIRGS